MAVDEVESTGEEAAGVVPAWDLRDQQLRLAAYDPVELVGERRMGTGMRFVNAGQEVLDVARIIDEVRLDWDRLGSEIQAAITREVDALIAAIDATLKMDSTHVDTTQTELPGHQTRCVNSGTLGKATSASSTDGSLRTSSRAA